MAGIKKPLSLTPQRFFSFLHKLKHLPGENKTPL